MGAAGGGLCLLVLGAFVVRQKLKGSKSRGGDASGRFVCVCLCALNCGVRVSVAGCFCLCACLSVCVLSVFVSVSVSVSVSVCSHAYMHAYVKWRNTHKGMMRKRICTSV